jgi:hypothetical protein
MLNRSAVERGNRLELVQGNGHPLPSRRGYPAGHGEHLGGDAGGVARRPHRGERQRELGAAGLICIEAELGPDRAEQLAGPAPQPAHRRVGRDERLGIGLEKPDVGAGRGDGDLDGEDLLPGQPAHHVPHQRRLAVAARRDQEHLLAGGQVAAEPGALLLAVGERRRGDDLAVDKRVVRCHYVIIRNDYVKQRNPSTRPGPPAPV